MGQYRFQAESLRGKSDTALVPEHASPIIGDLPLIAMLPGLQQCGQDAKRDANPIAVGEQAEHQLLTEMHSGDAEIVDLW